MVITDGGEQEMANSWPFDQMRATLIRSSYTFSRIQSVPSGSDRADVMGLGIHRTGTLGFKSHGR
jgi:hypothetical protein